MYLKNYLIFYFLFFVFYFGSASSLAICQSVSLPQDTLKNDQLLYIGRDWQNKYFIIKGDQYLFSNDFLPGYLCVNGKSFKDQWIRYDIYNDEIMIPTKHGSVLQLNKEMVDSFTFNFQGRLYHFTKLTSDTVKGFSGYANVLYKGETSLFVKYRKEVELLAVDRKYDQFYQVHKIYIVKDSVVYQVSGKGDLYNTLTDSEKVLLKTYISQNKIRISRRNPDSLVPVLKYYDSIKE